MLGRKVEKDSVHADATSRTLHMASEQYCPFMPGSTISSILKSLMYGFAYINIDHGKIGGTNTRVLELETILVSFDL
jgi:hypothetical protein